MREILKGLGCDGMQRRYINRRVQIDVLTAQIGMYALKRGVMGKRCC